MALNCNRRLIINGKCFYVSTNHLYIKAAKSFFNVPRDKLPPRPLAAEADNPEDVKVFPGQGVHHNFSIHFVSHQLFLILHFKKPDNNNSH
jgi:hypothetical protein